MDLERIVDPYEVYARDIAWIQSADVVISEVSTPSHGVGYEVAYALQIGRDVLCCHREGVPVSKMITGNDSPRLTLRAYSSPEDAIRIVDEYLRSLS
jgi:hypothetical protein